MTEVHRSALLPYAAVDVFDIVNDVQHYPDFLPWCEAAVVIERGVQRVVAKLSVRARGLSESFTTANDVQPGESIVMNLVDGPFDEFYGRWRFSSIGEDQGCRIELDMKFGFTGARRVFGRTFARVFTGAADQMVDAFCRRAHKLLANKAS
ncbi:MAG: type II toxin-antitoxin system RatA family toxin [Pseudomonadales bacterium]|jgi:ribosome-associated toxin RatA of RatAB toxin-antitoxin module|nr:type II toxin-antitoxin system RatA family toxin [Pseudomonadales bacterium]MDP6469618.1 type II toxin-antitoxin system RatA family toxin [Pseudomonadales bacterium]MDP6827459.1 type II toxin-antitoxin system RatA family toxin [Pseudomonadales bacterium]MDP6973196.1 type II toxin-antitoxin system RatA family toxin [Pseudomonadales bacterium]|tara:strand:+ start:1173 stop:1625 length:453 start_codon:yes stop_codon:yes gene_type:complete